MMVIEYVEFFKVIVIELNIFGSKIVDEKHFKTMEAAECFKQDIIHKYNDVICVICPM